MEKIEAIGDIIRNVRNDEFCEITTGLTMSQVKLGSMLRHKLDKTIEIQKQSTKCTEEFITLEDILYGLLDLIESIPENSPLTHLSTFRVKLC